MALGERSANRARWRLIAAAVLIVTVLVGLAVAGVSTLSGDSGSEDGPDSPGTSSPAPDNQDEDQDDDGPMTPARGNKVRLVEPGGQRAGMGVEWPDTTYGAISAAVSVRENLDLLDDARARSQMEAVASADSPEVIDRAVSDVRALREGLGLPPSGAAPTVGYFTAEVEAVRARTLTRLDDGSPVVEVWLHYTRYGHKAGGGPSDNPLRNQMDAVTVVREDDDWRVTHAYEHLSDYPMQYAPDSPRAWADGWWQVER
ncbi:hypothetical protein [Streptomyces bohaiensis]|uniref:hypothetical protein n=1 Tax=Streptomyces bohaiensis TaxID=1431344 RepID=UPI003B7CA7C5